MNLPSPVQLKWQILQQMKDQAPGYLQQLRRSGGAEIYAEQLAETMLNEFDSEMGPKLFDIMSTKRNLGTLERIKETTSAQSRAWEQIRATYLEWPPETPDEEQTTGPL